MCSADLLTSFAEDGLPERYSGPDGRKDVSQSWNPVELLKRPNWITLVALLVLILVAALVVVLVRWAARRQRNRRYGGRGHRWRRMM